MGEGGGGLGWAEVESTCCTGPLLLVGRVYNMAGSPLGTTQICFDADGEKMCCLNCDCQSAYPLPARRSYRRSLKPLTRRKLSAQNRIHMNSFWNQLEDLVANRQVEETSYVIDWEVNTDPETLACDREVEAVFSSNNNSIIHSASNSSVFGSDNYSDSDDDDLSFTSVSCWTEEEEDVSCYCSAASSRSPSPPMSLLLQPLVKRMPLPPLPMPLLGKMSLPLRERMPMTQKQRMPMPPSIQDTMSLLDIVDRFQSFRLCTAV